MNSFFTVIGEMYSGNIYYKILAYSIRPCRVEVIWKCNSEIYEYLILNLVNS